MFQVFFFCCCSHSAPELVQYCILHTTHTGWLVCNAAVVFVWDHTTSGLCVRSTADGRHYETKRLHVHFKGSSLFVLLRVAFKRDAQCLYFSPLSFNTNQDFNSASVFIKRLKQLGLLFFNVFFLLFSQVKPVGSCSLQSVHCSTERL